MSHIDYDCITKRNYVLPGCVCLIISNQLTSDLLYCCQQCDHVVHALTHRYRFLVSLRTSNDHASCWRTDDTTAQIQTLSEAVNIIEIVFRRSCIT